MSGIQQSPTDWRKDVAPYRKPSIGRSVWQLINTLVPYFVTWALMIQSLDGPYGWTVALAIVAGMLTVRLFIINHDCGHGSFFSSKRANNIVGFWTGALSFTPYLQWRHGHAIHHAKSGQVELAGVGYFWIMTLAEYEASPWYVRAYYRFYRNPFVLFLIGGIWLFVIEFRMSFRSTTRAQRLGVWANNAFWAAVVVGLGQWLGYWNAFLLLAPMAASAAFWGITLFYLQHHYADSYWAPTDEWDYTKAAIQGSSYVKLPAVVEWFAGAINYHHIHHLAPKIPNYRLKEAHHAIPLFRNVKPLSWGDIAASWRLRLIDEKTNRWCDFPSRRDVPKSQTSLAQ